MVIESQQAGSLGKATPSNAMWGSDVMVDILRALGDTRGRILYDRGLDIACRSTSAALVAADDIGVVASHLRLALQEEQITDVHYLPFTFEADLSGGVPKDVLRLLETEAQHGGITHVGVGAATRRPKTVHSPRARSRRGLPRSCSRRALSPVSTTPGATMARSVRFRTGPTT